MKLNELRDNPGAPLQFMVDGAPRLTVYQQTTVTH